MQKGTIIHTLVTQLFTLLDNWEQDTKVSVFLTSCCNQGQKSANEGLKTKEDPLHILAMHMQKANTASPAEFLSLSQFDVEELKTYEQAMNGPHIQQWAHGI